MNTEILVQEKIRGDIEITVYKNGYVLYDAGKKYTVFPLPPREGYCYDFVSGSSLVDAEVFEDAAWCGRLILEGEDRLAENERRRESSHKVVSYSSKGEDESPDLVDHSPGALEELLWKETLDELSSFLTGRQKEVMYLYYKKGFTQAEIACRIGVSQQQVSRILKGVKEIVRKRESGKDG